MNQPKERPVILDLLWMVGDAFRMVGELVASYLDELSPMVRLALLAFVFIGIGVAIS